MSFRCTAWEGVGAGFEYVQLGRLLAILLLQVVEPPLLLPVAELQNLLGLSRDEITGWSGVSKTTSSV